MQLISISIGLHIRLICCEILTAVIPTSVDMEVVSSVGMKISVGCVAPSWARYIIMLTGININPEVLITRNIIIGLVAVSFFGFSSCSSFMAFSPNGVAALSNPNMLADRFIKIDPMAGCPLGISGKRRQNTGLNQRESALIMPLFSPIFISPNQRARMPVRPRDIWNAFFEESKVELTSSVKISVSPIKMSLTSATMKAITKNVTQM